MQVPDIEVLPYPSQWPRPLDDFDMRRQAFDAIITKVEFLEDEVLRSENTRHLRVHMEWGTPEINSRLPAEMAPFFEEGGKATLEIWLDGKGRPRKEVGVVREFELWDLDQVQLPQGLPET